MDTDRTLRRQAASMLFPVVRVLLGRKVKKNRVVYIIFPGKCVTKIIIAKGGFLSPCRFEGVATLKIVDPCGLSTKIYTNLGEIEKSCKVVK